MDMTSVCLCVLMIGLLIDGGHSNFYTPCPDVLEFYRDGESVFGRITVQPEEVVSSLKIRLHYTVQSELGEDLGELKAPGDVLFKYNRGETVQYRVYLPLIKPWPKVTEISINDKAICTGPGDELIPKQIRSSPIISQTHFYGTGSGPPAYRRFRHEPQTARRPIPQMPPQPIQYRVITTTTTARPPTTRPVYVEPVTKKPPRPVQRFSDTRTTTVDCGKVEGDDGVSLINNGISYERGEVPWLVAIYKSTKKSLSAICGGTLVSDRHVVTAAHCMYSRTTTDFKDIVIKVGVHELDNWSDDSTVITKPIAADKHESYSYSTLENDIMVLTLDKRLNFTNFIRPACLWSGNTDLSQIVGSTAVVAGWGGINKYHAVPLDEPQMVRVPIVSTKECRASKSAFHTLTSDKTLCAGSRNGDGPCQGDSGGGLYLKDGGRWRLRGVVSRATQNEDNSAPCNLNEYVVYTDTAQYLPWIKSILSNDH